MKLRPIHSGDADRAADILARGFPAVPRSRWATVLGRLLAYSASLGEASIGQTVEIGGADAGICLTIPAKRSAYADPPHRVVNISSFFLAEKHRWMAPLMMKRIMAGSDAEFTDLTGTPAMRSINEKIGFTNHSNGAVLIAAPIAALQPGGARVKALDAHSGGMLQPDHKRIADDHARLGCLCFAVETEGGWHPLILAPKTRRGVPGTRIILARDRKLVADAAGSLARHLLRRRLAFIEFEARDTTGFPLALFWTKSPPFQSTRDDVGDAVDHTYSELVFF